MKQKKRQTSVVKNKKSASTKNIAQKRNSGFESKSTLTGTRLFDRSLHKTNSWLKELMTLLEWDNRERALSVLRATLHALRDILPLQENIHLSAQFPILLRGVFFENWHYHPEPLRLNTIHEFNELVREKLGRAANRFSSEEIRRASKASLFILTKHISAGEIYDIKGILRRHLRDLIAVSFDELEVLSHAEMMTQPSHASNKRPTSKQVQRKFEDHKFSRKRRIELNQQELREQHRQHHQRGIRH